MFVHVGGGVKLSEVRDYKERYDLKNIMILPFQPRESIHISLGSADIQVVSLGNNCVGLTHPNKVYGAMFIGKPMIYIGPDDSHISEILDDCPGNISVRHGDTDFLVKSLIDFACKEENDRELIGNRNRTIAQNHFHPDKLLKRMVKSIESTITS